MKLVIQRVKYGAVTVDGAAVGKISRGIVAFAGMEKGDGLSDAQYLRDKMLNLRIFSDPSGKMNRSLMDVKGEILLVSQFTLLGDCRRGKRPSFDRAMPPAEAEKLYTEFKEMLQQGSVTVETGRFGAMMEVEILNDGPVTFILDSRKA